MDNDFERIKYEYETGRLKEQDMSENEKNKLIDFYRQANEQFRIEIEKKEAGCKKKKAVARNYAIASLAFMLTGSLLSSLIDNNKNKTVPIIMLIN